MSTFTFIVNLIFNFFKQKEGWVEIIFVILNITPQMLSIVLILYLTQNIPVSLYIHISKDVHLVFPTLKKNLATFQKKLYYVVSCMFYHTFKAKCPVSTTTFYLEQINMNMATFYYVGWCSSRAGLKMNCLENGAKY